MKKLLRSFFLFAVLFSCQQASSPKETAQAFITSFLSADFTTASSLASSETKALLDNTHRKNHLPSLQEALQLNTLTETITGERADVKNSVLSFSMVKEGGDWKVVLNENLLGAIQQREELLTAARTKWLALRKAYEARLKVAKAYVDYKKGSGSLSPNVLSLTEMVYNVHADSIRTKEALLAYVQKQQQLHQAIDAAMEPSLAANSDLSLQYIVQISTAGDRIQQAEAEYQAAAQKAQSPVYVPLPFATTVQAAEYR